MGGGGVRRERMEYVASRRGGGGVNGVRGCEDQRILPSKRLPRCDNDTTPPAVQDLFQSRTQSNSV